MSRFLLSLVLVCSTATLALAAPAVTASDDPVAEIPIVLDRAAIRAKLLENRLANLERFRAYQRRGVFPNNVVTPGMLNVWLDPMGNLCAAATIMKMSGEHALVAQIARDDNFIRLADVERGPVLDWILTSGFTQAELVAIQKPFSGVGRPVEAIGMERPVVVVDAKLRAAETARLAKLYKQVEAKIVRDQRASLDAAVERLMNNPERAKQLLAS